MLNSFDAIPCVAVDANLKEVCMAASATLGGVQQRVRGGYDHWRR